MIKSPVELLQKASAQVPVSDYVPFGTHVKPSVIKLKNNGEYIVCWIVDGITFETIDQDEFLARKNGLNSLMHALSGGCFSVWTHKLRRQVHERLGGTYTNKFCAEFAERYYDGLGKQKQLVTELYVTLVYRPNPSKLGNLFRKMASRSVEQIAAQQAEELDMLDDVVKQVESSLAKYSPVRLKTYSKSGIEYSEMLRFLGYLTNGVWEEFPLRRANISEYLPTSRLFFGDNNGMLQIRNATLQGKDKFVGFLDIKEYPSFSEPGCANTILYGDFEYIETQSFSILNRRDAINALERQRGHMISSEDAAETDIRMMNDAVEMLASGHIEMGEYHYTLAIIGASLEEVAKNRADASAQMQDGPGFKMVSIDAVPEYAWFAQMPGNWKMRPREASLSSRVFVDLSPLHNFARGKPIGNPWGDALVIFNTPSGQPYYFNFHISPEGRDSIGDKHPGNTSIIGTTGVGKTTLEMALLALATKFQGLRCVFFDKDRGAEIGIRVFGGKYFAIKRGEPTGFNPFQLPLNESNIQFCEKLVCHLVKAQTATEEGYVSKAVRTVMNPSVARQHRRLAAIDQMLPNTGDNSLRVRLKKWIGDNPLGWVLDNPEDLQDFSDNTLFGYDYTEFLDDPTIRTPVMMYLLHITEALIDGRPFIYFMEEFWKPLMDEYFTDFALNKQKTIRKENGLGVFVTQSPSDVLKHSIGKTMVEQCVTQIFLPNPRADHDDYVNGFKITEQEFNIIKNLGENSRMFLVKQGHRSAICKMDLGHMPDVIDVISGSLDNVELLETIRAEVGDNPDVWLPIFHQRIADRKKKVSRA